MPRIVRNFWVEAFSDKRKVTFGASTSRDGTLRMNVFIRNKGSVVLAYKIFGWGGNEGELHLKIDSANNEVIHSMTTER